MLLIGKPSINGPFSRGMLNNLRVNHTYFSIIIEGFVNLADLVYICSPAAMRVYGDKRMDGRHQKGRG